MQVTSKEITYRVVIEQVFFDDDTSLVIKTGWPEGQEGDFDIDIEWETIKPDWANKLTDKELIELIDGWQE